MSTLTKEKFAMAGERQTVPARHGIATFVPKGHSLKVINTYGSQTIDTWAFALHKPPERYTEEEEKAEKEAIQQAEQEAQDTSQQDAGREEKAAVDELAPSQVQEATEDKAEEPQKDTETVPNTTPARADTTEAKEASTTEPTDAAKETTQKVQGKQTRTWASYIPSVPSVAALRRSKTAAAQGNEDSAKASDAQKPEEKVGEDAASPREGKKESKEPGKDVQSDGSDGDQADAKSVKSTRSWGSYMPAIRSRAKAMYARAGKQPAKDDGKGWLSYLPSGASFTSYLPSKEQAISAFAASHHRDPNKPYAEQLYEFSKTPVGAASLAAATGSGTAGSLYAAYSAYTKLQAAQKTSEPMEYISLPHTIDALQRLVPEPGDTLLTNLHAPILTLLEDTSPPVAAPTSADDLTPLRHGTILPACDPTTYRDLAEAGEKGEEHGSCAENLVLALQELNKSTGLKGSKTVGADVTINSVPTPLSLFMNATVHPGTGEVTVREPRFYEGGKRGRPGEKGGFVRFRAERDCVVVMSACPMDFGPHNGGRCMAANFVVQEPSEEERREMEEREKGVGRRDSGQEAVAESPGKAAKDATAGAGSGAVEEKGKVAESGVQTPGTEVSTASSEAIKNAPKPGRKKPKKLERRSSKAPA